MKEVYKGCQLPPLTGSLKTDFIKLNIGFHYVLFKEVYKGCQATPYRIFKDCFHKYSIYYVFHSVLFMKEVYKGCQLPPLTGSLKTAFINIVLIMYCTLFCYEGGL